MINNCEAKGIGCVLTLPIYRGREQHGNGREAGDKGTGSGRVRYGRREVLTPPAPPPPPHVSYGKMVKTDLYWGGRLEYKKHSKNSSTTTLNFSYAEKKR